MIAMTARTETGTETDPDSDPTHVTGETTRTPEAGQEVAITDIGRVGTTIEPQEMTLGQVDVTRMTLNTEHVTLVHIGRVEPIATIDPKIGCEVGQDLAPTPQRNPDILLAVQPEDTTIATTYATTAIGSAILQEIAVNSNQEEPSNQKSAIVENITPNLTRNFPQSNNIKNTSQTKVKPHATDSKHLQSLQQRHQTSNQP